jgi:hypothetical protein
MKVATHLTHQCIFSANDLLLDVGITEHKVGKRGVRRRKTRWIHSVVGETIRHVLTQHKIHS